MGMRSTFISEDVRLALPLSFIEQWEDRVNFSSADNSHLPFATDREISMPNEFMEALAEVMPAEFASRTDLDGHAGHFVRVVELREDGEVNYWRVSAGRVQFVCLRADTDRIR